MTSETLPSPPDAIKTKATTSFYSVSSYNNKTTPSLLSLSWNRFSLVCVTLFSTQGDAHARVCFLHAATGETRMVLWVKLQLFGRQRRLVTEELLITLRV